MQGPLQNFCQQGTVLFISSPHWLSHIFYSLPKFPSAVVYALTFDTALVLGKFTFQNETNKEKIIYLETTENSPFMKLSLLV